MALAPASSYKADAGLDLLDALERLGHKPEVLLVDPGYSYAQQEAWALPLAEREVEQVLDLHPNQRGTRPGPIKGTVWVDGGLFVQNLPKDLRSLPGYSLLMTREEMALLARRYDERRAYAFSTMGGPDPQRGTQRFRGPALAGRVRCANTPWSLRADPGTRPTTGCVKGQACACGRTLTLARDEMAQLRQSDLFGTTAWRASYGPRSAVESVNASVSEHHAHLPDRHPARLHPGSGEHPCADRALRLRHRQSSPGGHRDHAAAIQEQSAAPHPSLQAPPATHAEPTTRLWPADDGGQVDEPACPRRAHDPHRLTTPPR